jgi:hypothetical protein
MKKILKAFELYTLNDLIAWCLIPFLVATTK